MRYNQWIISCEIILPLYAPIKSGVESVIFTDKRVKRETLTHIISFHHGVGPEQHLVLFAKLRKNINENAICRECLYEKDLTKNACTIFIVKFQYM